MCHKTFDIATEDIEWEHIIDAGETEDDSSQHDFSLFQTVCCSHCGQENKIVLHTKGRSEADFDTIEVFSMETI